MLKETFRKIIEARSHDPYMVLGMHQLNAKNQTSPTVVVRVYRPGAKTVTVISQSAIPGEWIMDQIDPAGFFEVTIPEVVDVFPYSLRFTWPDGTAFETADPYSFLPVLSDYDRHLINEGNHYRLYDKLGAHIMTVEGHQGVHFAVWAPNAKRVSVVGDFNQWDGRIHQMRVLGLSGLWEIFIPGINEYSLYKFEILSQSNQIFLKSDPMSFAFEPRPRTASQVRNIDTYEWHDGKWIEEKTQSNWLEKPVAIYEVHLGSWRRNTDEESRFLTYRELADQLIPYVKEQGFTHMELLPVAEHPLDESWGYQVTGYYAATSRFGTPEDFMYFVDKAHQTGLGVLLDWVPAHFPKDAHGLARFDGTALYEHEDPRLGEQLDWGTLVFNFGRNEVSNFLLSNALFWLDKYHIDGLRVDAVASMLYLDYSRKPGEWIPNKYGGNENLEAIDFIRKLNVIVHEYFPGSLTIAEESTAFNGVSRPTYLGGLGFSMKWNMGWMHDILEYFSKDPVFRKFSHNNLTFALLYAFQENFILVLSHDEVVHGKASLLSKMPGNDHEKFSNLRALLGYMYAQPGKKLNFMGHEIGQWQEWNCNDQLPWSLLKFDRHIGLQNFVRDLNHLYVTEPALWEQDYHWEGFEWIDFYDADQSIISFLRKSKDSSDYIFAIFNFTPVPRINYHIGVPEKVFYKEVLNSDSAYYGGSDVGNMGGVEPKDEAWGKFPYTLELTLPPLSALYFKPIRNK